MEEEKERPKTLGRCCLCSKIAVPQESWIDSTEIVHDWCLKNSSKPPSEWPLEKKHSKARSNDFGTSSFDHRLSIQVDRHQTQIDRYIERRLKALQAAAEKRSSEQNNPIQHNEVQVRMHASSKIETAVPKFWDKMAMFEAKNLDVKNEKPGVIFDSITHEVVNDDELLNDYQNETGETISPLSSSGSINISTSNVRRKSEQYEYIISMQGVTTDPNTTQKNENTNNTDIKDKGLVVDNNTSTSNNDINEENNDNECAISVTNDNTQNEEENNTDTPAGPVPIRVHHTINVTDDNIQNEILDKSNTSETKDSKQEISNDFTSCQYSVISTPGTVENEVVSIVEKNETAVQNEIIAENEKIALLEEKQINEETEKNQEKLTPIVIPQPILQRSVSENLPPPLETKKPTSKPYDDLSLPVSPAGKAKAGFNTIKKLFKGFKKHPKVFGTPLTEVSSADFSLIGSSVIAHVPEILLLASEVLKKKYLKEKGLFRIQCLQNDLDKLINKCDRGEITLPVHLENYSAEVLANLIKNYLNQLPTPVVPFEFYSKFIEADRNTDGDKVREIAISIPNPNCGLLLWICRFLAEVSLYEKWSCMNSMNLAIVLSPSLLRPQVETMETIIKDTRHVVAVTHLLIEGQVEILREYHKDLVDNIEKESANVINSECVFEDNLSPDVSS